MRNLLCALWQGPMSPLIVKAPEPVTPSTRSDYDTVRNQVKDVAHLIRNEFPHCQRAYHMPYANYRDLEFRFRPFRIPSLPKIRLPHIEVV